MLVICPSGLQFEARPWTLGDQNYLTDTAIVESGVLPLKMVQIAFLALRAPGPYRFETTVNFDEVTLSDITAANLQIRKCSDRNTRFEFNFPCQHCGKIQHAGVDLDEVDVFSCSDDGIAHISSGAPLELHLESMNGPATAHLKLLRGADLSVLNKWQKQDPGGMLEIQTCYSIQKIIIKGQKNPIVGMKSVRNFWKEQSWAFGRAVRDALDDAEGGADVVFLHRCDPVKGCGKEQEGVLPLGPEFYGLQRPKSQRKGRKLFSEEHSTEMPTPEPSSTS